ncbi:glycosyl hydrolase family 18 protein [Saccharothrix violaceirubra]|uniref:chitinase n=1 Tax=Saccharothrix violaceirubra TaxID=413306 RepID=A0A7W7T619_9PSEU|nr:glycosyl hydrolase family 18 protein [Saccharothrix violaceirubra]MBB4967238.1 hypothetical protein [Saccharothrix violaceirubra]
MRPSRILIGLTAALAAVAVGSAPAPAAPAKAAAATPLPAHVFAPYFEAWTGDNPLTLSKASGAKYLTFAFLQTQSPGSCTPLWNGDPNMPISSSVFGSEIKAMQAAGGDAIPSFGGYTADTTGTELADSCSDVNKIAEAYQKLITTYDISRIDLDIEIDALDNTAGVDRRNKAVKLTQDWAAANGRKVEFSYTLPTTTRGLAANGVALLRNAAQNNTRVDVVNIMTFDYYDNATHNMAEDTKTAAQGLVNQMAQVWPGKTQAQLWASVGVTEMIGVDDFGPAETFTLANAPVVLDWAREKNINTLSFWALQRDNGNCPGGSAADNCSGIAQKQWEFTGIFAPFSGGGTPQPDNDFSVGVTPSSVALDPGKTASATVNTAVVKGTAQNVALTASVSGGSGVTASVAPGSVTAGGTATVTVNAAATATPGAYTVTVTGTAGTTTHTATLSVTVNGGQPGGPLANGDFESGVLAPWTAPGDSIVSTPAHSGTHALQVTPSASSTGQASQVVTLAPNKQYTLKAWVRGNYVYIGVSGGATGSAWTSSADWKQLSVTFTTGASGTATVYAHGWYGQSPVFVDDVTVG